MEKSMKVYGAFQKVKKGSSLMMTLILISILSTIFLYWNECYKVQMASYYKAQALERDETRLDLAFNVMKPQKIHHCRIKIEADGGRYYLEYKEHKDKHYCYLGLYDTDYRPLSRRYRYQ